MVLYDSPQASAKPISSRIEISGDKTAELDFGFVKHELRTRIEFNRRAQSLMFAALGGLVVSTRFAGHFRLMCLLGLLLNYILLHGVVKNTTYVRYAAFYNTAIFNKRYSIPISEWETFLLVA